MSPVSVRQFMGRLHAQRGDPGEGWPRVSGLPQHHGALWHVRVRRHRHVLHVAGWHFLPFGHRQVSPSQSLVV